MDRGNNGQSDGRSCYGIETEPACSYDCIGGIFDKLVRSQKELIYLKSSHNPRLPWNFKASFGGSSAEARE